MNLLHSIHHKGNYSYQKTNISFYLNGFIYTEFYNTHLSTISIVDIAIGQCESTLKGQKFWSFCLNGKLVDRKGIVSIFGIIFDVSNEKDLLTDLTVWSLSFFYIKYGKANNFDTVFFVFDLELATRVGVSWIIFPAKMQPKASMTFS